MAKNTIVDTVGHAVLRAEIAAVKAVRRVIGAAQHKVASLGEAVGKKTKAREILIRFMLSPPPSRPLWSAANLTLP